MKTQQKSPKSRKWQVVVALVALCAFASSTAAQRSGSLPDTPAGKQAEALLAMLRQTGEASVRAFLQERMGSPLQRVPMETHVQRFQQMREVAAGAQVVEVSMRSPEQITVVLKAAAGDPLRLTLEVNPQPPHRIEGFRFGPDEERPAISFSSWDDLDRQLQEQAAADQFSGVVLVSRGGKPLFHRAYGTADRAAGVPNRPDTRFNLGSIDKNFTAVAVLRLAQEGRLGLDDPIGKYLKGFPPEIATRVTVRQLLQHSSGMGDYLTHPTFTANRAGFQNVSDYLALARTLPLEFEPGARRRYSNLGYAVLGGVVEAAAGKSYYDVVQDWIFRPAGMASRGEERQPGSSFPTRPSAPREGRLPVAGTAPRRIWLALPMRSSTIACWTGSTPTCSSGGSSLAMSPRGSARLLVWQAEPRASIAVWRSIRAPERWWWC
jgi:CubicO group peptidase (beta-lactamase class C family)